MKDVKSATIVFSWEGNILITAPCKVNTKTKFIYDIGKNDYEGDENALRVLEKSYVIIDGKEYSANFANTPESVSGYYYTNSSYLFEIKSMTDVIKQEDIDLDDKLCNMLDSEISEATYDNCNALYEEIEAKIWELLNDEDSVFSNPDTYQGLEGEYEAIDNHDLWTSRLYNCDLLYMTAIADVLDLPTPEDSSDTQMFW